MKLIDFKGVIELAIDGFFTRALVQELQESLNQGRIHKIYQPFQQELQMVIRSNRTNYRLAGSSHPTNFALYLTEERPANPEQAPMFCMLLRKHLIGTRILAIEQYQNDRIIDFYLQGRDEIGVDQEYLLTFELMGRHSNIILVNQANQEIIDCIKHVPVYQNSYRILAPGAPFKRPPQNTNQINLFALDDSALFNFASDHQDLLAEGQGFKVIQGMSKLSASALAYWMHASGGSLSALAALERLKSIMAYPAPVLYKSQDKVQFYAFKLPQLDSPSQVYPSLSQLLEGFLAEKIHLDRVKQVTGTLLDRIQHTIKKNQKKLTKLAQDRQIASQADDYRIQGELLNAYAYQVSKGQDQIEVTNYYDDSQITIDLDPQLSAVENAQVYFKKYQKYRDALKYIDHERQTAQEEIDYLEGILVQLDQADLEDIETIKQELIHQGYVTQKKGSSKKRAKTQSKPRRFKSSDGVMIYVGRNNQQNDDLSLKKASKNHWWLHAKDIPGAHVIIESDAPSDLTLTQAANLAAYFSKSAHSANVPVDTVQAKHLRKPNGARPGYVIYEGQRTLYVTPDEELIKELQVDES